MGILGRRSARALYAAPREVASVEDCHFYHVMDLPGVGTVGGDWDLRGREREYLGDVPLAGRSVLEIGPANGFLSFWMEQQGAEVTAIELAPDEEWDVVPHARLDLDAIRASRVPVMERLRNGFWFAHARFGSRVRLHYGSAYAIPPALGRFDVALMAAVLLHTRDPLRILEGCARVADTVVVTDLHVPELDGAPVARFEPAFDSDNWDTWWRMSPELLTRFLAVLGHREATVTFHEQTHLGGGVSHPMPMFTVVARRA